MFPAAFFGPRFFASRYWPKVGASAGGTLPFTRFASTATRVSASPGNATATRTNAAPGKSTITGA